MNKSDITRFWNKVDINGEECWEWLGGRLPRGYGRFWLNGKDIGAHRFSWLLHFGEIKNGLFVCHKCDNPSCVNPSHLFIGTAHDNSMDMARKGRARTNPPKIHGMLLHPERRPCGEKNGSAKLTQVLVDEIRELQKNAKISQRELSKKFGISKSQIERILNYKNWNINQKGKQ